MLKNYIKFGFRAITSDKKSALLHIVGLGISLASVVLISLWVNDELTYNSKFSKSDEIYQLTAQFETNSEKFNYSVPSPIAVFGKKEIPAVADACRAISTPKMSFGNGHLKFDEVGIYADDSFFKLFDLPSRFINVNQPFSSERALVITRSLAKKYFGKQDPLGQTIEIQLDWILKTNKEHFVISGVIDDFPENSSLNGDFILPISLLQDITGENLQDKWGDFQYDVFFLLHKDADQHEVADQLTWMQKKQFGNLDTSVSSSGLYRDFSYHLQRITESKLYKPNGRADGIQLVYTFSGVAFIILLIACMNYVNLVTAKMTKKSREMSLRKIVGASRKDLFFQYTVESSIIFFIALLFAITLANLSMPIFNMLSRKNLAIDFLSNDIYIIFVLTFSTTFIFAGIYPAILFSRNKVVNLLKTEITPLGSKQNVRKLLVVIQFSFTVILIVSTIAFKNQLDFMRQKNLGYDKENVFLFEQKNFLEHYDAIRNELEKQSGIRGVTAASSDLSNFGSETADISWAGKSQDQRNFFITQVSIDRNFTEVMDIRLTEGIGFTGTAADSSYAIINETALREMGIKDPIGKTIQFHQRELTIAGVARDFNFNDLKTEIKPCILFMGMGYALGGMYVKAAPGNADVALDAVQKLWTKYNPETDFSYFFLDEAFDRLYKKDILSTQLITVFSVLAILLSCMGLAGLITFTTETKLKEIGIRKTLGASVYGIVLLILKDFLVPVFISITIAFPISWLIISRWLDNYVYRISLDWWIFMLSALITLVLVLLTAGRTSIKAAKMNPVNSLRNE